MKKIKTPKISVVGIGGGGCNTISHMTNKDFNQGIPKKVNHITFINKEKDSSKIMEKSNISFSSDENTPDPIQDQGVEFS